MILTAVDERAAAMGLAPGLSLADARARVPDLETIANAEGVADLYRRSLEMGLPKMAVKSFTRSAPV